MLNSTTNRNNQLDFRSLKNTFIDEEKLKALDHSTIIEKHQSSGKRNRRAFHFKNQLEKAAVSPISLNSSYENHHFGFFASNENFTYSCKIAKDL